MPSTQSGKPLSVEAHHQLSVQLDEQIGLFEAVIANCEKFAEEADEGYQVGLR